MEWAAEGNRLHTTYFPQRTQILLDQLKTARLYPTVDAPRFLINGVSRHGVSIPAGDELSIQTPAGTIYYTLDGSDPRGSEPMPAMDRGVAILVAEDTSKRVFVPGGPLDDGWRASLSYDDSSWRMGVGGVGYERAGGYESLIGTDVGEDLYGVNTTCCIRIPFVCEDDPCDYETMTLSVRYDDGFVAYLNGVEIARALFTGVPQWDSHADGGHEAEGFQSFDVSPYLALLQPGGNLLAIQGMNASSTSSDFLISAELSAAGRVRPDEQVLPDNRPIRGADCPVGQRLCEVACLGGGGMEAMNEAVFAVGPVVESLRISEIMYHPPDTGDPNDPNAEFIELTNIGASPSI